MRRGEPISRRTQIKIAYAFRRGTLYPFVAGQGWSLPGGDTRTRYLRHVDDIGFDGIGASGVSITIEVHQHSIADNSWSALHLLDLTDSP